MRKLLNVDLALLACVLNQLCNRNDRMPIDPTLVSKFHALRPPAIGILDYLDRIAKYAACSGECFVLALIYIDRIIQSNPSFVVNSLNIHRLLITSVMLGAKFFDDQYFNNAYFAKVGGVPRVEVNALEVEFLFMTNFSLFVTTEQYTQYYTELNNHVLHSNCSCSRKGIRVPPLKIPALIQCRGEPYPERPPSLEAAPAPDPEDDGAAIEDEYDEPSSDDGTNVMATDSPQVYSSSPPVKAH